MAEIHTLKKNGITIYPQTHMQAVVDDNGNTVNELIESFEGRLNNTIEAGNIILDNEVNSESSNPVMNKAISQALDEAVQMGRELAKRDLYIAAGAEYNDTDQIIKKTAFWGEEVDHLPHHYYLNGLGDITEEQMADIYEYKDAMYWIMGGINCTRMFQDIKSPRTLFAPKDYRYALNLSVQSYAFHFCNKIEVVKFVHANEWKSDYNYISMSIIAFYNNEELKVVDTFRQSSITEISAPKLTHIRAVLINNFSVSQSSLITKDSVLYMINKFVVPSSNATNNTPYTIKLHPDVYAKCIEGGEWYEEINTALVAKNESLSAKNYSLNIVSA